ncbi:MAG: DUF4199 domain-containing protein [Prevotellaceae bacterium]|jgi:hypothetical protein|nr:DUF4199 domain-containing protein [Prevotellaceae bacterium]
MRNVIIQNAARDGLILGAAAVIFIFLIPSAFWITAILQFAKLGLTIGLFWYLMKRQSARSEVFTYSNAIGYGTLTAVFSAFILGVVYFLQFTVISPELTELMLMNMMQVYEQMNMPELVEAVDSFRPYIPYTVFIICLFYYTLIGLVYSLIIGHFVKHRTPPSFI